MSALRKQPSNFYHISLCKFRAGMAGAFMRSKAPFVGVPSVFGGSAPFQVPYFITALYTISMVDLRLPFWVRNKGERNQSGRKKLLPFVMMIQPYKKIALLVRVLSKRHTASLRNSPSSAGDKARQASHSPFVGDQVAFRVRRYGAWEPELLHILEIKGGIIRFIKRFVKCINNQT